MIGHMGEIVTETSAWPLVVVRMSDQTAPIRDDEYVRFFEEQRALFRRDGKFATVVDVRMGMPASAVQRRMMTDWLRESDAAMRQWAVGLGVVTRSAVIRGGLRAVLWIKEPAVPTKIVASVFEGIAYCIERLEANGVRGLEAARRLQDEARRTMT
jgi:hypothetical protein